MKMRKIKTRDYRCHIFILELVSWDEYVLKGFRLGTARSVGETLSVGNVELANTADAQHYCEVGDT
jgi:hypothetical protein